jgi:hypothetical protein
MCDCIKNFEDTLTSRMSELNPGSEVIDKVTLTNKSFDSTLNNFKLFAPITGRFKKNGRTTKFDDRLIFTYCPLCGVKY